MKYPLFLSDFDGTLVRADGTVSATCIRAIRRYRAAGGIFAVCTGRMLSSIRPRLGELGLTDGIVVAFQGAQIADIATGRLLKDEAFSVPEALEVLRVLERRGLHLHIYAGEDLYANRRDGFLEAYERVCGVKGKVPDFPLSDMVAANHMRVVKILVMCAPSERAGIRAMAEEAFGKTFSVTCSSDMLVEIMPKDQTKAAAVSFLGEFFHIGKEKIAAIGDQENDIPMVAAAGGRFAVGNAVGALKQIATVVPSVEEDGVAVALGYAMGENL